MSRYLLSLVFVGLAGCVTPASSPPLVQANRPAFEAVVISGLSFQDQRLSSRSEGVASGYGVAQVGNVRGYSSGWGVAETATYEAYENTSLRQVLKRAIEDGKVARRVVSDAPTRIEGRILPSEDRSGAGRLLYDLFLSLPTLGIFPWLGVTETAVELRIYHNDELVRTFTGTGRANWSAPLLTIAVYNGQAAALARQLAVVDAVGQMAAQANEVANLIPNSWITPARPVSTGQRAKMSLCSARSRDAASLDRCRRGQSVAYQRLEPAIERVKLNPSSNEAVALKQCYGGAQSEHGTDWVAVEHCTLPEAGPASPYRQLGT